MYTSFAKRVPSWRRKKLSYSHITC